MGAYTAGHPTPSVVVRLIKRSGGHAARDWKAFEPLIGHARSDAVRRMSGLGGFKPAEIADLLEDADKAEGGEILDRARSDPDLEADVFEELDPDKAGRLLDRMPDGEVAGLLGRMRADDAADAIADLRRSRRRRVLDLMRRAAHQGDHPDRFEPRERRRTDERRLRLLRCRRDRGHRARADRRRPHHTARALIKMHVLVGDRASPMSCQ